MSVESFLFMGYDVRLCEREINVIYLYKMNLCFIIYSFNLNSFMQLINITSMMEISLKKKLIIHSCYMYNH